MLIPVVIENGFFVLILQTPISALLMAHLEPPRLICSLSKGLQLL